jgi:superfamily II DNA or RNA helicase
MTPEVGIPSATLRWLEVAPTDRPVMVLLRHAARHPIPSGEVGDEVFLTEEGVRIATALGAVVGERLVGLYSSPVRRCLETADALARGADVLLKCTPDLYLGAPGVFVKDPEAAWEHVWKRMPYEEILNALVEGRDDLVGFTVWLRGSVMASRPSAPDSLHVRHIPGGGNPDTLIEVVRVRGVLGGRWPTDMRKAEQDACSRSLNALELVDGDGALTDRGQGLVDTEDRLTAFNQIFATSRVGRAWIFMQGAADVADLDPASAREFVDTYAAVIRDRQRVAETLEGWAKWCQQPARLPPTTPFAKSASTVSTNPRWPSAARFPHNEAAQAVASTVLADLAQGAILVVVGYAALEEMIPFLSDQLGRSPRRIRLLFGNEPFPKGRPAWPATPLTLPEEARQFWLDFGYSVLRSAQILQAREIVASEHTEVRFTSPRHPLHAKIYMSDSALTLGSSNFTRMGLRRQSEANARFQSEDPRYAEARELAEGFWLSSVDYKEDLLQLLDALLKEVSWQEALGRACAEILEGRWAEKYIPPEELDALPKPLWPHQRQGISQALWALQHTGSVLIADAAGSGKTRMGAWILRAVYDWRIRLGHGPRPRPLVIAPQSVTGKWQNDLLEAGLNWYVNSSGALSHTRARAHAYVLKNIETCELLAVDEAHNYFNEMADRTQRLLANTSDHAILFTATPISRRGGDLLGLVDLLGSDHFTDGAQARLDRLYAYRVDDDPTTADDRDALRREIQTFTVRRTKQQLNRFVDKDPDAYKLESGRTARYPKSIPRTYTLTPSEADLKIAGDIVLIANQLTGIARVGNSLSLGQRQREEGVTDEAYLNRLTVSAAGLARHMVLDCLRSSTAALVEHIFGTDEAIARLKTELVGRSRIKNPTGNVVGKLDHLAGQPPKWELREELRTIAPEWLVDASAHNRACQEERQRYRTIAALAEKLSGARERAKCDHLARLYREGRKVIAFDSHSLTLHLFGAMLRRDKLLAEVLTGEDGEQGKRTAEKLLGLEANSDPVVVLFSDAFSESLNLQKPSVVVHLDYPTVIREAEQRVGRIDRMDSPNDEIQVWYPDEMGGFTPRRRDRLRERNELVSDLMGANLELPRDGLDEPLKPEDPIDAAPSGDPADLGDAFGSVRSMTEEGGLVGPAIYRQMRESQDRIVACVSVVRSTASWGFFAVGSDNREAPRWVLLDDGGLPQTDLRVISAALGDRLRNAQESLSLRNVPPADVDRLIVRLAEHERRLLPLRRQRMLDLAERVMRSWFLKAEDEGDIVRSDVLRQWQAVLRPRWNENEVPHLRGVADLWSQLTRKHKQEALRSRPKRKRWGLYALEEPLRMDPISTETLRAALEQVPRIQSLDRRIVAMIIGVRAIGVESN